jgi:hypothetical protein
MLSDLTFASRLGSGVVVVVVAVEILRFRRGAGN